MGKIKFNVNGQEMEADFDTLDKETMEELGIKFHEEYKENQKNKPRWRRIKNKLIGITPFICLIAFFLTGNFIDNAWTWNWSFFLLIPLVSILFNLNFKKVRRVVSAILGLLVITIYLITGIFFGAWSWNWVMFFIFPIIWILCGE